VTHARLAAAIAALRRASADAELSPSDGLDEAAALAAAVCGDADEAAEAWSKIFERPQSGFAPAAALGKPWLDEQTPLLRRVLAFGTAETARGYASALASVAVEACVLDPDPGLETVTAAERAAGSQLRAAGLPAPDHTPVGVPESSIPKTEDTTAPKEPEAPLPSLSELLDQLDALIGLDEVKAQVRRQTALLRMTNLRAEKGLKTPTVSRHLVFVGNPGTGKSTVARLVAGIYRAVGLLEKGTLVETDRSDLVAGYLGQTAIKTDKVIESALGGVLFIDEAYSLAEDHFGEECISTLVKAMEDHRDELVVIVAGYPHEMANFIAINPGLESRFSTTIVFPDYTDDELVAIFRQLAKGSDFEPTDGCIARLRDILAATPRDKGFGNGRFVRNLFEAAIAHHAWRLRDKTDLSLVEMRRLHADDLPEDGTGIA
jgi:Holliday junction resolvasome RuvABC ATP-dependent DNA helicase subunit